MCIHLFLWDRSGGVNVYCCGVMCSSGDNFCDNFSFRFTGVEQIDCCWRVTLANSSVNSVEFIFKRVDLPCGSVFTGFLSWLFKDTLVFALKQPDKCLLGRQIFYRNFLSEYIGRMLIMWLLLVHLLHSLLHWFVQTPNPIKVKSN